MRKASKPFQTTINNCRLESSKSTDVPLGSSHHDVDYKDDEDSMFMVRAQFNVTTIFLPNQIKAMKNYYMLPKHKKGFWSQDGKFGKLGSKT